MKTLDYYRGIFEQALSEIDLDKSPTTLYEPVRYILDLGGKRLRPTLVLAACDYCQGDLNQALKPAIGLELFHNFTLLHDDIMDKAPIRRGFPTVHEKWDTNRAILSGDTMFALAGKMMLETEPQAVHASLELFFKTAIEVCEGQQMDMDFESQDDVTTEQYLQMIGLKTAVLIAACLQTGAYIAKAPMEIAASLYRFGYLCGIAFQLQDDYLDVFGDENNFGKTAGGDIASNKKTWLYLKALELADDPLHEKLRNLYAPKTTMLADKVNRVRKIFLELDIPKHIRALMLEYHDQAIAQLKLSSDAYGPSPVLQAFAAKMIQREN